MCSDFASWTRNARGIITDEENRCRGIVPFTSEFEPLESVPLSLLKITTFAVLFRQMVFTIGGFSRRVQLHE
jgi:hypothetical protein